MCLNTIGWNLHLQPLTMRAQHVPASKLPEYWPTSSNKIVSPGLPHTTPYYPITCPCPLERNLHKTNSYKSDKYYDTQSYLEKKGCKVYLVPFEMSLWGQILKHTQTDIFTTLTHFNNRRKKLSNPWARFSYSEPSPSSTPTKPRSGSTQPFSAPSPLFRRTGSQFGELSTDSYFLVADCTE